MSYPSGMPSHLPPMPPGYVGAGGRPGLVTALGVASIVIGGLGLLATFVSGLWTLGMYRSAQVVATVTSGTNTRAGSIAPALTLPTPDELEADATSKRDLRLSRRSGLISLLGEVRRLDPAIEKQIDGMLARHAERILPAKVLSAPEVSTDDLRALIESMGSLPPVQAGDTAGVFFQFRGTGRLEVYADRAVFKPTDGSGTLRSSGPATPAEEDQAIASLAENRAVTPAPANAPAPFPAAPVAGIPSVLYPSGLNGQEIQSIVQKAQAASGGKLNAAQQATLGNLLQSRPPLVSSQMAYSPIRLAMIQPDGQAIIVFSSGTVVLDSAGVAVNQTSNDFQEVTIDPIGLTLLTGEMIAAAALAVLLLTTGILTIRNSPKAQTLHWVYALLKLPVAIVGAVAFAWVAGDLFGGVNRMSNTADENWFATVALWIGIAGAIYPLIVIAVLCVPVVRDYFGVERAKA